MILKHDVQAREEERNELAKMAEQFIQNGGTIKRLPTDRRAEDGPRFNNRKKS